MKEVLDFVMLLGFVLFMVFLLKGFTKQTMKKHEDKENK